MFSGVHSLPDHLPHSRGIARAGLPDNKRLGKAELPASLPSQSPRGPPIPPSALTPELTTQSVSLFQIKPNHPNPEQQNPSQPIDLAAKINVQCFMPLNLCSITVATDNWPHFCFKHLVIKYNMNAKNCVKQLT